MQHEHIVQHDPGNTITWPPSIVHRIWYFVARVSEDTLLLLYCLRASYTPIIHEHEFFKSINTPAIIET